MFPVLPTLRAFLSLKSGAIVGVDLADGKTRHTFDRSPPGAAVEVFELGARVIVVEEQRITAHEGSDVVWSLKLARGLGTFPSEGACPYVGRGATRSTGRVSRLGSAP